jgi:primary-amine oxidase
MTDTAVRDAEVPGALPAHPLDPATAAEYLAGRDILAAAGLLAEPVRFAYYGLEEPPKQDVLAGPGRDGRPPDRRLRAFLINLATGESSDVVVSLLQRQVTGVRRLDPATDGQLPIIETDFAVVEEVCRADPDWRAALARRGLMDVTKIRHCPITAGVFGEPDADPRRMVRVLAFVQAREHDLAWAHPVDGITAYVDLIEKKVFKIVDEFELPVPAESGDYDDPAVRGPERTTLRPIEITQPEGPSFTLDGHCVRWQDWSMRIGFDAREGLTLHQISLHGDGRERPVLYRASIPEMVVPYGDPRFRYWQSYFDAGEYLVGKWANSLELGCDCLGEIAYLDATVTDDAGQPRVIKNAICIHEEDFGILWKHTDIFNGSAQSRRQRRLVVSFFATVGNYDYGFYWYFYLDGAIECEIKMTGVVFTAAHPGGDHPHSTEVAPGLGAPAHQHLFSARLDMSVDGLANAVEEVDVSGQPIGPDNPYGNALVQKVTRFGRESQAARRADGARGRTWRVISTERTNRFGRPVSYTLYPEPAPVLLGPGRADLPAGRVRDHPSVGHQVRPGAALPGGRLREPASWRGRAARVHRRGQGHRRCRHRGLAHLRAHALPEAGGLAGDAGRAVRLHAQADRVLRPQPHAGRAAATRALSA